MGSLPAAGRTLALLCDADGCLFPSEEPAFFASADVVNRFLASIGSSDRLHPEELRLASTGKNFRTIATELAAARGTTVEPEVLEEWVREERVSVTEHLRGALLPNPWVRESLRRLAGRYRLAVVSSSATARLDACFEATLLEELFPAELRFSAEDSLPAPTSKPDPAIYVHAARALGIEPEQGLAIEDSVPGVQSAVAAGCPVVGNVTFVPGPERAERVAALSDEGAVAVIHSWSELAGLLPAADRAARAIAGPRS